MKPKGLLYSAIVLVVLGGLVWWSNRKQASASKSPTTTTTKILAISDDQIAAIKLTKKDGATTDLKRENGKWQITEPKPLRADQDSVSSLTGNLSALNADNVIEEKATDFSQYGLDKPALDVQVTKKDGKTDDLLIGDDTPTNSGAYARLANDPRVFTVGTYVKTGLDKTSNDLRDKRLLTFDQDKLTRVDLQAKGQPIEFGKNAQNEWEIIKPKPLRADSSSVDTLIGKLKDAKLDPSVSPDDARKAAAAFASGTKVATATVTDSSGTQTLDVRKDKDKNYYAKSSAVDGIYKVPSDVGDGLDKSLDDFRNKKVFDFGFSDPTKIELQNATYTKSGDKWMSGSKNMDNTSVQNLIDKLRDLSATKFVEKGGGSPVFVATVTSNSGKRVEKVTITRQGDQYFAQRENEPSIYELDAKAVTDLQQAASAIKEAAPEPAKKK